MVRRHRAGRDTKTPLVSDAVAWQVQRDPAEVAAGKRFLWAVEVLLELSSGGPIDLPPTRSRLPIDPDDELHLVEPAKIHGAAPWLPKPAFGPQHLSMSSRAAWIRPGTGLTTRRVVPLEHLTLVSASCRDRFRHPRRPSARWSLEVEGPDAHATVSGAWLALAWLGHLARWPEPEIAR